MAHKAAAAAAWANKDRQFKAYQQELGLLSDNDGEELAPSIPQKAAAQHPVVQSPHQHDGGAPGKCTTQVEPDLSSSILIPTLPPNLLTLVSNLLGPAGQDARRTKLPVSRGPSGSPYIEALPCRSRSGHQAGHLAPGTLHPFTMLDSNFLVMEGVSLAPCDSGLLQVRTKTWAEHAAADVGE
jgi:hypothetical protein